MELGVACIVDDHCVSPGRVKHAVRRESSGQRVARQLVNVSEWTRLIIAIRRRPVEQLG